MPITLESRLQTPGGMVWAPGAPVPWVRRLNTPKIAGDAACTALTTLALTASRLYFVPFTVPRQVDLGGLRISVTTASAGSASIGIYGQYAPGGDEGAGSLIASATGLNTGTTGDKSFGFANSVRLVTGRTYWAALICSATPTLRALAVGSVQMALGRAVNATGAITHLFAAGDGSTLPQDAPYPLSEGTGSVPAIYLLEI